jgi:hypothetical protein
MRAASYADPACAASLKCFCDCSRKFWFGFHALAAIPTIWRIIKTASEAAVIEVEQFYGTKKSDR